MKDTDCPKCHGAGMILKKDAMYPVKCECLTPKTVCPRCGCKGKKTPHKRIWPVEKAQEMGYRDMMCGSCGYPFRSYPRIRPQK